MSASQPAASRPIVEWRDHLALTLLGAGLLGALVWVLLPLQYPFGNDTSGYVQEAQNWLRGKGLSRGGFWYETTQDFAPFPIYPPGFAFEIAGLSKLGLSLPRAAVTSSWLAWLLLLPAIAFAVRPLVGRWTAMVIAVLAASSPGFVEYGYLALSDSGMVLYSVMSLGILMRQDCGRDGAVYAIFLSGMFAGCAYLLRNAAAVLPLSVMAFFGMSLLLRRVDLRGMIRSGLSWGTGFAVLAFPMFIYNFRTFGSIQPYLAAHDTIDFGVLNAFRITLWSMLLDISSWRSVADMAWSVVAISLLVLPAGLLWLLIGWARWKQASHSSQSAVLLLLLYMSIGCAIVIWGRSHFNWVEVTLVRHVMPFSWGALAVIAWALRPNGPTSSRFAHWFLVASITAGLALAAGRLNNILTNIDRETSIQSAVDAHGYAEAAARLPEAVFTNHIRQDKRRDHELVSLLKALPNNAHIVSNHASMLSLETERHIRQFDPSPEFLNELMNLRSRLGTRPLVLAMLPSNNILRSPLANSWQDDVLRHLRDGYEVLLRTENVLVVSLP